MISAVFLDRDGTIIRDTAYIGDPGDVHLVEGAADAIRRLNATGIPVIVVTNQSGIGRGLYTEQDYERVRRRLELLLAETETHIDASYHCPHHPDAKCDCRKPGVSLFRKAAADHQIDLTKAFYVGDRVRDVQPAETLGGRGILVLSESTPPDERHGTGSAAIVGSLAEAVDLIIAAS